MDREALSRRALELGAAGARWIPGEAVATDPMFRTLCAENTCGKYGKCWMCPPAVGDVTHWIRAVKSYDLALLYETVGQLEDSFDIEGMLAAGQAHGSLSRKLQQELTPEERLHSLHLTCGGCGICTVCAMTKGKPCVAPSRALPSLEGCGVDVYTTARRAGLPYTNGTNTVTYFGLLLVRRDDHG